MAKTIVIHLDVNGTIMAADQAQGKTSEDAMTQEFAKKTKGIWREDLSEMRYQDYVEQHLIQGSESDRDVKKQRRELYTNFLTMLKETGHSSLREIQHRYDNLMQILCQQEGPLYASFWNLLDWAQKSEHDVRFVFRTFGNDIPEIIGLLKDKGYSTTNIFGFEGDVLYRGHFKGQEFVKDEVCQDLAQISTDPFNAVKDDWQYWNGHQETEAYAKPFHYQENSLSIFFDDNAKAKQIVAPKKFMGPNGQPLTTHDLLKSGHIVAVSPLKAMVDPNYFVAHIHKMLEQFA